MNWSTVRYMLGVLLIGFSPTMLLPMSVSLWYADGELEHFLLTLATTLGAGLLLWLPARTGPHAPRISAAAQAARQVD